MVYLAPARALVQEKARDWGERFGKALGLVVQEMTGGRRARTARGGPKRLLHCPAFACHATVEAALLV